MNEKSDTLVPSTTLVGLFIPSFDWKFINWNLKFIEFILEMTERGIFLSKILNGKMRKRKREREVLVRRDVSECCKSFHIVHG
jgi:hypothetical protein